MTFQRFFSPCASASAKCIACSIVMLPGIGGSLGSTTASTTAGPGWASACRSTSSHLRRVVQREARRAAGLARIGEVDRLQLARRTRGLPSSTICSHLICPSALFLMTITFTGSLYFTSVAISPISMVKPAVADDADHLAAGVGDRRADAVRQAVGHGRQHAGERELHVAAHVDVARGPGGDRAAVGDHDGVVVQQLVQLVGDHLRLHRLVRRACRAPP